MIEPHSACGATGPGGGATEGRFSTTPPGPGETAPRTFCLPAALQNGFLSFKTDAPG